MLSNLFCFISLHKLLIFSMTRQVKGVCNFVESKVVSVRVIVEQSIYESEFETYRCRPPS